MIVVSRTMVVTYAFGVRASDEWLAKSHNSEDARQRKAPPLAGGVAGPQRKLFCGVLHIDLPWASTTVHCPCSRSGYRSRYRSR